MRILFLGDVVARSGRDAVFRNLKQLKKDYRADFAVVNAENSAHGKGISAKIYHRLMQSGADAVTLGNHAFSKKEIIKSIDLCPSLVRPANLEPLDVGCDAVVTECCGKRIAVVNILCQAFMCPVSEKPIPAMEKLLSKISADIIICDLHGESTGEKMLFARYFADRLTAVIGTHTHVQTADERIIGGCAFISDVGMCGAYDSILGRDADELMANLIENRITRYTPAAGPAIICGCLIETDDETDRAVRITRIQIRPDQD